MMRGRSPSSRAAGSAWKNAGKTVARGRGGKTETIRIREFRELGKGFSVGSLPPTSNGARARAPGENKSRLIPPLICHARNNTSSLCLYIHVHSRPPARNVGGTLISGKVAGRGKSRRLTRSSRAGVVEETLNMAGGGSVYTALVRSVSEVRQHLP